MGAWAGSDLGIPQWLQARAGSGWGFPDGLEPEQELEGLCEAKPNMHKPWQGRIWVFPNDCEPEWEPGPGGHTLMAWS